MRIPVWLVAAGVIVMSLLSGVIVGVALDRRVLLHHSGGPFFLARGPGGFIRHVTMAPERLKDELGLSAAQTASVDSIMRHRMSQRDSLMTRTWPVMRQLLDSTRIDIERVLTPEQRTKFQQLREHEFGPPPGPPGMMLR
ncbi:MAG TPA: hypothetical protein VFA43_04215 [Gemmatimonadaceae bacterium]|nr:hypothetical protein [Gemmatimonadaceae bacterium]